MSDIEDGDEIELPDAWFALDGDALYALLVRVYDGESPDEVYMELFEEAIETDGIGAPQPPTNTWLGRRTNHEES
jgi:hypothetical protein